jgi:hypothetical protein
MRTARGVLAVAGAILSLGLSAPTVWAASTPTELHVVKDCRTHNGVAPTYCTITVSNVDGIPIGMKIWYTGPVLANSYFLSSNVRLDDDLGDTATGYCIFQARTSLGLCTFWAGTGKLSGFTSVVDVTIDANGLWHFDGMYYFDDTPRPPDTSTVGQERSGHGRGLRAL